MNARLKVLHEKANVKSVKLLPTTVIGRSTECDLKISSSEVSRIHCRITVKDDAVFIEDLGSANGTFVNDKMLTPRQVTLLDPGTKITIGPAEFLVDYSAPTSNTVVIRRSGTEGKQAADATANRSDTTSRDMVFSSTTGADESSSEATIAEPIENLISSSSKEILPDDPQPDVPKIVSAAAVIPPTPRPTPIPAAKIVEQASERVTPAPIAKPSVAPKPAVAVPAAPQTPKAVPASPVPVARAVPVQATPIVAKSKADPISPANPLQFSAPQATAAATPNKPQPNPPGPPKVAPPAAQFLVPEPAADISDSVEPSGDDSCQFDFASSSEPRHFEKPSPKAKSGGLMSIFSAFSRKPKPVSTNSNQTVPVPEQAEAQPQLEQKIVAEPAEEPAPFSFSAEDTVCGSADESINERLPDDDFQKFLRQF